MLTDRTISKFLDELASNSPAPGGGSVAALAGSLGSALTSMVCNLTIGKKKYVEVDREMRTVLTASESLRETFRGLIEKDTEAFSKVMEAYSLPKDTDDQKALRSTAIQQAMKEATLVPLEVMKHVIDAVALAKTVASKGNANSISDAGVSALMLRAALEGAAMNVEINLKGIDDSEFTGWKSEEVSSLQRTCRIEVEQILDIVRAKLVA